MKEPKQKAGATYHGFVPDTDPRYTSGGWNYLLGKNLRPDQTAQQAAKERELFARLKTVKQYPIEPDEPNDGE